jgi:hypothetical protein
VFRVDGSAIKLPPRLHDIVLTVGTGWRTGYQIYAQTPFAKAAGLSDTVIEAIVSGERFTKTAGGRRQIRPSGGRTRRRRAGGTVRVTGPYLSVCAIINAFDITVPSDPEQTINSSP